MELRRTSMQTQWDIGSEGWVNNGGAHAVALVREVWAACAAHSRQGEALS